MKKKIFVLLGLIFILFCSFLLTNKREDLLQVFNMTEEFKIQDIKVMYHQDKAELYPVIELKCNQPIKDRAKININGIQGLTVVEKDKIIYRPKQILRPNTTYDVQIYMYDHKELMMVKNWSFTTRDLPENQIWVEVSLAKEAHKVYIRQGKDQILREMLCSGGTEDQPSIMGTYYLKNRGNQFYSERFKEGALYWVRIKDQYLFHSVPRDKEGHIIEEEAEKIGGPASHGCIRLIDEDAKWFFENIEDGTMVIIHD